MRWVVPLLYLALAAASVATALALAEQPAPGARVVAAEGGFTLSNSVGGEPVFTAAEIGPGDSATGTVELAASGGDAADLTLTRGALTDTPGLGAEPLSAALDLRVRELGTTPATVYSGPLATMPAQELGRIEPGAPRTFEFVASLPEAGQEVDQNALQGAETNVAYIWTASEAAEEPEPTPGGGGGGAGQPGGPAAADELDLELIRVRHWIRRGRLVAWLSCDHPCAVAVRGKLRARDGDDRRRAKLRSRPDHSFEAGTQKLTVKLPRGLRRWLREDPSHERVRGRATFLAWDQAGDRDTVKRALRLRSAR